MDNNELVVNGEGFESFELAMRLAFAQDKVAKFYSIDEQDGMILYWYKRQGTPIIEQETPCTRLPYDMDVTAATQFVWNWLLQTDYPRRPDIDGECEKGWRLYRDMWGNVPQACQGSIISIKPLWAMYGK